MKKFQLIAAAVMAIGVAAPTLASAETVVIRKHHGDEFRRAHDYYRPGWRDHYRHGDRTVIIKKGGGYHRDYRDY